MKLNKKLIFLILLYPLFLFSQIEGDDVYVKAGKAIFFIRTFDSNGIKKAEGTAFFTDPNALAATAFHILKGADSVYMVNKDGEYYYFDSIVKAYPAADIVQFRIKQKKAAYPFIPLTKTMLYEGDEAFAIGINSEKQIYAADGPVSIIRMFQGVGPGLLAMINMNEVHNGAPLVNMNGEAIGIISFPLVLKYEVNFALSSKVITDEEDRLAIPLTKKEIAEAEKLEKQKAKEAATNAKKYEEYDFKTLAEKEKELKPFGDSILDGCNDFSKMDALTDFIPLFVKALKIRGSYYYPFDSLKFMTILNAPDNTFRLYNWTLPFTNQTYRFYGAIQKNNAELDLIPLYDFSQKTNLLTAEDSANTNESWYGAQYFDMMMFKHKGKKYYVLLGWNGNELISHKKIIEILSFDEKGNVVLGAPIIDYKGDILYRKIIQYNDAAIVILKAIPEKKLIVFDHLVPPAPKDKGKLWLYIPDGNYDYFKFRKGKLVFGEDLFENEKLPKEAIDVIPPKK